MKKIPNYLTVSIGIFILLISFFVFYACHPPSPSHPPLYTGEEFSCVMRVDKMGDKYQVHLKFKNRFVFPQKEEVVKRSWSFDNFAANEWREEKMRERAGWGYKSILTYTYRGEKIDVPYGYLFRLRITPKEKNIVTCEGILVQHSKMAQGADIHTDCELGVEKTIIDRKYGTAK